MLNDKRIVAVIPARAGSKRLPGKNMNFFGGRPLIEWTIRAAQQSGLFDDIIVSTDDSVTMEHSRHLGVSVPFRRPEALSGDDASSTEVILHALDYTEKPDLVVCLQPTSPLRTAEDIRALLQRQLVMNADTMMSVCRFPKPAHWFYPLDNHGILYASPNETGTNWVLPNGAIYSATMNWLAEHRTFYQPGATVAWEMPYMRSVDIDTPEDWKMAEAIFAYCASQTGGERV